MTHVKLKVDVAEGGRDLAKAKAAADAFGLPPGDQHYPRLKVALRRGNVIEFTAGAIVCVSEATAAKWIKAGLCEAAEVLADAQD